VYLYFICYFVGYWLLSPTGSNLKHMQKQKKKRTQKKRLNKAVSQLAKQIKQGQ